MKKFLALLLAVLMVLSLAACGQTATPNDSQTADEPKGSGTTEQPASTPVTLIVVTSYGGDDGNRKNFEAAVKAYEEATGYKIITMQPSLLKRWNEEVSIV